MVYRVSVSPDQGEYVMDPTDNSFEGPSLINDPSVQ